MIEDCPARDFLGTFGQELPRPRAIVVASAHYEAPTPLVGAAPAPHTIHDFTGFPDELYRLECPAPGDPDLARDIASRLIAAGCATKVSC